MINKLQEKYEKKQQENNELAKQYNEKLNAKKTLEAEMIEIEKQILLNQGCITAYEDLAKEIIDEEGTEVIETVSDEN